MCAFSKCFSCCSFPFVHKGHTHFICLYRICQRLTRLIVAAHYHNKYIHADTHTTNVIVTGCCPTPSTSLHTCIIKRDSHPVREATQVDLVISLARMPHKFFVICQKNVQKRKVYVVERGMLDWPIPCSKILLDSLAIHAS